MERQDLMITEFALSAVAALLILQSLFLLRVAVTGAEESSNVSSFSESETVTSIGHPSSPAAQVFTHTATGAN